jgi:Tol biopolymer transport system component
MMILSVVILVATPASHPLQSVMFHSARWSADGSQLLLTRHDGSAQGYLFDVHKGELRAVTKSEFDRVESSWRQPSRAVEVFERQTASGQTVGARTRGTAAARTLSIEPWAEQPSLSPDGQSIVYEARDNPHDVLASWIVVVDTAGKNRRRLYHGTDPSWSPDGKHILFKTPRNGVLYITTIPSSGGDATLLAAGVHPAWSPDGKRIAYMADSGRRSDIWLMQADGRSKKCITCSVK